MFPYDFWNYFLHFCEKYCCYFDRVLPPWLDLFPGILLFYLFIYIILFIIYYFDAIVNEINLISLTVHC